MRNSLSPCVFQLSRLSRTVNPQVMKASRALSSQTFSVASARQHQTIQKSLIKRDQRLAHTIASPDRTNTVGFIGLGAMGNHMVLAPTGNVQEVEVTNPLVAQLNNLINRTLTETGKAKYNFAVFDVNDETMDRVIKHHQSKNPETKLIKCSCKRTLSSQCQ